jgi:transcriptional pleiotropic regulator of transition state genes
MKDTGITRRLDELGRIVIPAELRKLYGLVPGDAIDIAVDGDHIVLRKVDVACVFCDGVIELRTFKGRAVCAACAADVTSAERTAVEMGPGDQPRVSDRS